MSAETDATVICRSLETPAVFAEIFSRHFDAVHGHLSRRAGRQTADELAGDVFRVAFERRHTFDLERPSARPWLYGIATNVLRRHQRDGWRRDRAHRRFQLREPAQTEDTAETAVAAVDAERQRVRLHTALRALKRRDRDALLLHVWEGLSYAEVAEALGVPKGTVRSRLNRARRRLRSALEEQEPAPAQLLPTYGPSSL